MCDVETAQALRDDATRVTICVCEIKILFEERESNKRGGAATTLFALCVGNIPGNCVWWSPQVAAHIFNRIFDEYFARCFSKVE